MLNFGIFQDSIKYLVFFFGFYRKNIILLFAITLVISFTSIIDSLLLKNIIDLIESFSDEYITHLSKYIIIWSIIYAFWWQFINFINRIYDYLHMKTLPMVKGKVVEELYNHVQHCNYQFFQDNATGDITNKITEGSKAIELCFERINGDIIRQVALVLFSICTMYYVHSILALIFAIWVVMFFIISILYGARIGKYSKIFAYNRSKLSGKIVDALSNILVIKMFARYSSEKDHLNNHINTTIDSDKYMRRFMIKLYFFMGTSCAIMIFFLVYFIMSLRAQLLLSIGDCVLVLSLACTVVDEVWDMMHDFGEIIQELGTFMNSMNLLKFDTSYNDHDDGKILNVTKGVIEFRNVTFCYRDKRKIFNNKSITIESKQSVGLVGFSGSGKTTFANLIARLYDIQDGSILIDDQDLKSLSKHSLRQNISVIPQDPILFNRSIFENIHYGKITATREEVFNAAKLAHIDKVIESLPNDYDTICGESGKYLSGGQRQRIVIARAILKNAPILILDEATSSLDSHTESLIKESLDILMQNKTVIVIAHRLSTVLNMDKILVFDSGGVVGSGSHSELLKTNDLYQKLWHSQSIIL
ncbi:MAG: ABC transporter ATP-binding protein [Rickettsiaceae bacterium]